MEWRFTGMPICGCHDCHRPPTPRPRCPICAKPRWSSSSRSARKRCADVDLNRWLSGVYAVPGKEEEDEDGGEPDGR